MNRKEFLKPTKWKIILIVFALLVVYFLVINPLLLESNQLGTEALRAQANSMCAKSLEFECILMVTSGNCQYNCVYSEQLDYCIAKIPGAPLPSAPAGTFC